MNLIIDEPGGLGYAETEGIHSPLCTDHQWINYCECGANGGCPICRWGRGTYPCKCGPLKFLENVTIA